jgi:hypothetical protein
VRVQLLLSQEYDDDWLDNPVVGGSWGLTWPFKEQWDDAMQVRGGVQRRCRRSGQAAAAPLACIYSSLFTHRFRCLGCVVHVPAESRRQQHYDTWGAHISGVHL